MDLFGSNALFSNVKPNDALVGIFLSSFWIYAHDEILKE